MEIAERNCFDCKDKLSSLTSQSEIEEDDRIGRPVSSVIVGHDPETISSSDSDVYSIEAGIAAKSLACSELGPLLPGVTRTRRLQYPVWQPFRRVPRNGMRPTGRIAAGGA